MDNPSKIGGKTTIDSMLDLLRDRGRIDVNSISTILDISPSVIEDWAKILESGGLVSINYEFGHMFITPSKKTTEQNTAVSEIINVQKTKTIQDIEFETLKVNELKTRIDHLQKGTNELEKQFSKDFPRLHKYLDELETIFRKSSEMSKGLDELKRRADKEYGGVIDKFNLDYKQIKETMDKSVDTEKIRVLIDDAKKFEDEIDRLKISKKTELGSLRKEAEENVKTLKNTINDAEKEIDIGIKATSKQVKEELKNLEEWDSILKRTNKQLPKLINDESIKFNKFIKLKEDITDMYKDIKNKTDHVLDEYNGKLMPIYEDIDEIKQKLSEPGDIGNTIISAKNEIVGVQKDIVNLKKEFMLISKELKGVSKNKKLSTERKLNKISKITEKNENFKKKIIKTDTKMKGITRLLNLIGVEKKNTKTNK